MVEVWLKFGKTEVFSDIPQEASLDIIENKPTWEIPNFNDAINNLFNEYQDTMPKNEDGYTILIDYVDGINGYDKLIFSLVVKIIETGMEPEKIKIITTAWRYGMHEIELEARDKLRQEFKRIGIQKIETIDDTMLGSNSSKIDIAVLPITYWQNKITNSTEILSRYSNIPKPQLFVNPIVGYSGYIYEIRYGDSPQTLSEMKDEVCSIVVEGKPEIIILGSNGYPTDYTLYSCMHIPTSLQGKLEDTIIIFVAECMKGLGPEDFIDKLVSIKTEEPKENIEDYPMISKWLELTKKAKICMTTLLPSTLVETLLNAKQATTLDEALIYAWRIKSKNSHVTVIPNPLFSTIRIM